MANRSIYWTPLIIVLGCIAAVPLLTKIDRNAIKDWQTLISAAVTFTGLIVASWNVTRQMTLSARAHELARLERDLPGIGFARNFVSSIANTISNGPPVPADIVHELGRKDLSARDSAGFQNEIAKALPNTPEQIRSIISMTLFSVLDAARVIQNTHVAYETAMDEYKQQAASAIKARKKPQLCLVRPLDSQLRRPREALEDRIKSLNVLSATLSEKIDQDTRKLLTLQKLHDQILSIDDLEGPPLR